MRIKITSYTLCNWTQTGRRCSKNLLVDRTLFLHFKLLYCFKASGIQNFIFSSTQLVGVTSHVMLDEDPVWIWRGNRDYGSGNFLVHAPGTAWAGHWAVPIKEHRSWQLSDTNIKLWIGKFATVDAQMSCCVWAGQRAVVTASWVCGNKYW